MALLDRFFKPKWQHSNPQIRRQALQTLDAQDPVLLQLAREDEDPGLRREALSRLNDLSLLQQISEEDSEAGVREYAQIRFRNILAGKDDYCPTLELRLNLLQQIISDELTQFLATQGSEPELRLAALQKMPDNQPCFAQMAINDPSLNVRTAALDRVTDPVHMEQIARQTRNRDKRVSRIARERLEKQRGEQQRHDHIQQLCNDMESLTWDGETGPGAARFVKLEDQWRELAEFAPQASRQRYRMARDRFHARLQESSARRLTRQALCQSLQEQIKQIQNASELSLSADSPVPALLEQTRLQWRETGPIDQYDLESQRLQRQFEELCQELGRHDQQVREHSRQTQQRRTVLQATEALLQQTGQVLEADVHDLRQRWQRLPNQNNQLFINELQNSFDHLLERLHARLQLQSQQKEQEVETIRDLIDRLEQALDEGELQQAIDLEKQAQDTLQHNISLSRQQMAQFRERIQGCGSVINRLRGWRRWGTNRVRESLCEEIAKLPDTVENPVELARLIRAARNTWQELDSQEGSAPRPLWKRFNDTCERAYEPCRIHFDTLSKERQDNLDKRMALCECLENFEAETDWENVGDWRDIGRIEQDVQNQWRKLGPVNRGDRKMIDRRYQNALTRLQTHLKPQIEQDLQRRQALIQQVEALLESDDLRASIEKVKKIQAEWQPQVLGSRRREQALWKRFRAACDAIFARRQSERDALDAERKANLEKKISLCERIEELAGQQGQEILQARSEIAQIRQQWEMIGEVPRNSLQSIIQRFKAVSGKFEKNLHRQKHLTARADMEGLKARAALCRRIETLLVSGLTQDSAPGNDTMENSTMDNGDDALVAQLRQQWESLPALKAGQMEADVKKRFTAACRAIDDTSERQQLIQKLNDHHEKKKLLCLRMEIATGSQTPAEFAQDRLEYQVARLSESMVERNAMPAQEKARAEAETIEREWYATGSLPVEQDQILERRFQNALATTLD